MPYEIKAKVGRTIRRHVVSTKAEATKIKNNLNNSGLGFNATIRKVKGKRK